MTIIDLQLRLPSSASGPNVANNERRRGATFSVDELPQSHCTLFAISLIFNVNVNKSPIFPNAKIAINIGYFQQNKMGIS